MKNTGIVRNIDELGRVVIPKEMRKSLSMGNGEPVEISLEGDVRTVRKYHPYCFFCGSFEGLGDFKGKRICHACLEEIKSLAD